MIIKCTTHPTKVYKEQQRTSSSHMISNSSYAAPPTEVDFVTLSPEAIISNKALSINQTDPIRSARVNELIKRLDSGTYNVSSVLIAEKMLEFSTCNRKE